MKSLNSTQKIENARSVTSFLQLFLLTGVLLFISIFPESSSADMQSIHDITTRQEISWKSLKFEGSKFLHTIYVNMQLDTTDLLLQNTSIEPYNCQISKDNTILTLRSSSEGLGGGDGQYVEQIAFNNSTLAVDNRSRLSTVKEKWLKLYCWEKTGVRRYRISPRNTDEEQSSEKKWTEISTSFYSFPKNTASCMTISDPALLPYLLSTLKRDRADDIVNLCVFGKKQLHHLIITQKKATTLNVSYLSHSSGNSTSIKEQLTPLAYAVTPVPFDDSDEKTEPFSFLGLQDNITIYIDQKRGIPLQVSGKTSAIGNIELNITEVTY